MINNLQSFTPAMINRLHQSNIEFTLTGSRFFKPTLTTKDVDWDFFTINTSKTNHWLYDNNFRIQPRMTEVEYADCATVKVYQYHDQECTIDVQMIEDKLYYRAKQIVQQMIVIYDLQALIDRQTTTLTNRSNLWSILIDLAHKLVCVDLAHKLVCEKSK